MRVCPEQRVGERQQPPVDLTYFDDPCKVFEVHLMHDAGVRWNDLKILKGALAPTQEGIPLPVPLELHLGVSQHRGRSSEFVDLNGVVDHQLGRKQRIDADRVPAERMHRLAHCGEIDDRRHPGEVLEEDAARPEGDFVPRLG